MIRSKKQVRVSGHENVKARLPLYVHKRVTIVLRDNTVFFGDLTDVTTEKVTLSNMRRKEIKLPIEKISEFFSDIDA